VWITTGEEVATYVRQLINDGKYVPRTDQLPFYNGRLPQLAKDYFMRAR
jgi:hypothetical protein